MSSTCIEKLPCPDCGSSDSLQTYLNIDDDLGMEFYTSFCHGSCWVNKGDPYGDKQAPTVVVKTEAEIKAEVAVIQNCEIFKYGLEYRGIPMKFYKSWGCRLLLSEFDGVSPYAIGFPYSDDLKLVGWKARPLRKKDFFGIGRTRNVEPFGLLRAMRIGGNILWVTEGEFDAIALDYCMTLAGVKKAYPVISLTHGGGSLEQNFTLIEKFIRTIEHVVFVLDDDEVGHKAEQTAKDMLGSKAKFIRKPEGCKDANHAVLDRQALTMGKLALNKMK